MFFMNILYRREVKLNKKAEAKEEAIAADNADNAVRQINVV